MRNLLCLLTVVLMAMNGITQEMPISEKEKTKAIDSIVSVLNKYYVLPDKASEMGTYLIQQNRKKAYGNLVTYNTFLNQLNKDLQAIHKDLHLRLSFDPAKAALVRKATGQKPDSTLYKKREAEQRYFNYGVTRVARLEGNITYIEIRQFVPVTEAAKRTVDAALTMNPDPAAFIIDLRENGGGAIDMGRYISSYFFADSVHLSDVINRMTGKTDSYWTQPHSIRQNFAHKPVYVLTSGSTFSAAEEFVYTLKSRKRALVIGEKTAGGAHGFGSVAINDAIVIGIPFERIVNAVTGDNWEGTGVVPDRLVASAQALETAQLLAMDSTQLSIDSEEAKGEWAWRREFLQAFLKPVKVDREVLQSYVGSYGPWEVVLAEDDLYVQRKNKTKFRLFPIRVGYFYAKDLAYRLQFAKEGEAMKLYLVFEDGYRQEMK